jgi:hypothetical protein
MKLLDQLVAERAEIATAVEAVLDRAAEETRDLTETEDSNLADLTTRAKTIDARIADLREIPVTTRFSVTATPPSSSVTRLPVSV